MCPVTSTADICFPILSSLSMLYGSHRSPRTLSLDDKSSPKGFFTLTELTTQPSEKTHLSLPKLAGVGATPRQPSSRTKQTGSLLMLASAKQGLARRKGEGTLQRNRTVTSLEKYDQEAGE